MAVGRRKLLGSGNIPSGGFGVVYTAPVAPADGSAAASITLVTVYQNSGSTQTITMILSGIVVWVTAVSTGQTDKFPFTTDLMGGQTVQMVTTGGAATANYSLFGVEAKDS